MKEVVNPEAAEGAEDPESRDDARKNAPTTVLTLDRAVSLQDYEDFARTFAGIAKAQAVWVWDGRKRSVFLTVAGPDGEVLEEDGAVIAKLKEALRAYGDPFVAFTIKSYRQALFQVHGTVTIHADHVIDTVMAAVTAALLAALFVRRARLRPAGGAERSHRRDSIRARRRRRRYRQVLSQRRADTGVQAAARCRSPGHGRRRHRAGGGTCCCSTNHRLTNLKAIQ